MSTTDILALALAVASLVVAAWAASTAHKRVGGRSNAISNVAKHGFV